MAVEIRITLAARLSFRDKRPSHRADGEIDTARIVGGTPEARCQEAGVACLGICRRKAGATPAQTGKLSLMSRPHRLFIADGTSGTTLPVTGQSDIVAENGKSKIATWW